MPRFFVRIQYAGTAFSGWQSQPNAPTIQDEIEASLEKVLRLKTTIVGCGRTDAGVHASDYVFHFDGEVEDPMQLAFKLNRMLPKSISVVELRKTDSSFHARFDAKRRSYEYHIHKRKNPFRSGLSYHYPRIFNENLDLLGATASLYTQHKDFFTFCKTNTDVKTTICDVMHSEWRVSEQHLVFHVSADRFLRGMVRLMVGACINVAEGRLDLSMVEEALLAKKRLTRDLSAPANGLFLSKIEY